MPSAPASNLPANPELLATIPRQTYERRLTETQAEEASEQERDHRFVRIRTGIFIGSVLLGILCVGESEHVSWLWMLVPTGIFLTILPFHQRCLRQLQLARSRVQFYTSRIRRLDRVFGPDVADGAEFGSEDHPWTSDLDVFGRGSLFQMLNECRTQPGRQMLATWMTSLADADDIRLRQTRAQGLKPHVELRERLACIPDSPNWKNAENLLRQWVQEPSVPIPMGLLIWSGLIGIISVPIIALVMLDMMSIRWLLLTVILQTPAVLLTRQQIRSTASQMDNVDSALRQFAQVIEVFEKSSVDEPAVRDLLNRFHCAEGTASRAIDGLSRLTQWLNNSMRNQFFAPLAWACGLFVLVTHLLEVWRRRHGPDVADWLETVACLEASVSVAGYSFDHPEDCLPEIVGDEPLLEADQLGHPLLKPESCVRNSLALTRTHPLMLVSGSNMSGKSTFLRSIGSSVVLTLCGSVVRATRFRTYPFQLGTAMRVSDSLQEGRSLFYSVVRRLKTVVDLTEKPRIVLFLLDEILHGTNSHDRRRGAEAVIRSLVARHALGIVTTHDLALTQIADTMGNQAVNKHFEDTIVDGKMSFDYTLRDGIVERSNAIALMRMLGLDV
ncbi:MAG: MutS-related protein [Planctomycetota bacterium]